MKRIQTPEAILFDDGVAAGLSLDADCTSSILSLLGVGLTREPGLARFKMTQWKQFSAGVFDDGTDLTFFISPWSLLGFRLDGATVRKGVAFMAGPMPDTAMTACLGSTRARAAAGRRRGRGVRPALAGADSGFEAAADDRGFMVRARGGAARALLTRLVDAYLEADLAVIHDSRCLPQPGARLNLVIATMVPDSVQARMIEEQRDQAALAQAAASTGIADRLKAAQKGYYALEPRWRDAPGGEVVFFLNPMNQDENRHGWFTVGELEQWCRGEGPIPMPAASRDGPARSPGP